MCGIAGCIDMRSGADKNLIESMTSVVRYRGPDDEGYVFIGSNTALPACGGDSVKEAAAMYPLVGELDCGECFLAFGHRRMGVADASPAARQPMNDGDLWIIYNGEVYNYIEVRGQLETLGHTFKTQGDTEVILKAYAQWGEDCVTRFNGCWAFAVWDAKRSVLFCSRDRLGVKPFHYYLKDETFLFGSELKQIIQAPFVKRVMNEPVLAAGLLYGISDYNEQTLIKDILTLKAGHNLSLRLDPEAKKIVSADIRRYWKLDTEYDRAPPKGGYADYIGEEFSRAVNLRMRCDMPVGALLSGGLDSSCIVAEVCGGIKKNGGDPASFETFTSGFTGDASCDERHFAHIAAESCGCSENVVYPDETAVMRSFEQLVRHTEGFCGFAVLGLYNILKEVRRKGIKVVLNGQGGDESMFGYERYYAFYFWNLIKKGKIKALITEYSLASRHSKLSANALLRYFLYFNFPFVRESIKKLTAGRYLNKQAISQIDKKTLIPLMRPASLQQLQYNELTGPQLAHLLRLDDRVSMAHSIETRCPFIDYRFIEKAAKIPVEYKISNGYTKALMREYMREKMPPGIVWRTNKMGFNAPVKKWGAAFDSDYVRELFNNPRSGIYFKMNAVKRLYNENPGHQIVQGFFTIEIFMRLFDVKPQE